MGWTRDVASDERLVAAIGDQDREALAEVYRRHSGTVWAVTQRICGSGLRAEEVCAAIFAELWSQPGRYDPARGSLRAWLAAEAHARAVAAPRPGRDTPTPPSAEVEVAELTAQLPAATLQALGQLTSAERDAVVLAYLGGRSCHEAARLLGCSEDAVKRHLRRGLQNLRQELDAQGVTQ